MRKSCVIRGRESTYPGARIAEQAHPGTVFTPFPGMPTTCHASKYAFRVRHHDRETTIRGGQTGNAVRRTIGIEWIGFAGFTVVVDILQGDQVGLQCCLLRLRILELRPSFTMGNDYRHA